MKDLGDREAALPREPKPVEAAIAVRSLASANSSARDSALATI
jgi:hypothetical protein